ncbi:hypothetical protein [Nocardioides houyundeii]|uniref:hypothetical protein n=1 Tax=Nocardioides houyundeii TaxID=2045452 RepID=UPI0013159456|nr:hypothetical protein [Nocardioides houyundeii]
MIERHQKTLRLLLAAYVVVLLFVVFQPVADVGNGAIDRVWRLLVELGASSSFAPRNGWSSCSTW